MDKNLDERIAARTDAALDDLMDDFYKQIKQEMHNRINEQLMVWMKKGFSEPFTLMWDLDGKLYSTTISTKLISK